jgi:ABC-type phosphate transport system substrate-binding protein
MKRSVRGLTVLALATAAGGAVGITQASATTSTHTLRLTTQQIEDVNSNTADVAADKDQQQGNTTGYDVTSCRIDFSTHIANCDVAVARAVGLIYAHVKVNVDTGKGSGTVIGGTRHFHGATGTVTAAPGSSQGTTQVTIRYQLPR